MAVLSEFQRIRFWLNPSEVARAAIHYVSCLEVDLIWRFHEAWCISTNTYRNGTSGYGKSLYLSLVIGPKHRFCCVSLISEAACNVTTKFEISDFPPKMVVPKTSSNLPITHPIFGVRDCASAGNHTKNHVRHVWLNHWRIRWKLTELHLFKHRIAKTIISKYKQSTTTYRTQKVTCISWIGWRWCQTISDMIRTGTRQGNALSELILVRASSCLSLIPSTATRGTVCYTSTEGNTWYFYA
jgi:hypothetical protein